jgi:TRAP-type C4-dicarboxylate transport system substrate-binding protein
VIKIASIAPGRSPWDKALQQVANDWERLSNGTVQVKIYPGSIAGGEQDVIRKMRLGVVQGGVFSNMGMAKIDHSLTVLCIPFLFHTRDEFNAVFERMKPTFEKIIEDKGFKVVLWTLAGWVNFFSKSQVVDPDDLKKLKISVTADFPEVEQVWKHMGYEVVTGNDNDLMIQLQSGAVTALYLPALVAGSGQFFALAPHMFSPSLAPLVGGLLLSDKAWASIPAELHQPFLEAVANAAKGLYDETVSLEADAVKMMKDNGLVVHDPPAAALVKWREAADQAVSGLLGTVFSKEIYDQITGYVQQYRKSHGQ